MSVSMLASLLMLMVVAVAVAVASEDHEANKVRCQAEATDDKHNLGVFDIGGIKEPRDSFENDGDAESDQEDGVEESSQNFGSQPLWGNVSNGLS